MNETIRLLIENIDAETRWALKKKSAAVQIWAPEDSAYLRSVERKANLLGIRTLIIKRAPELPCTSRAYPVVADNERGLEFGGLPSERDPDNLFQENDDMSCVAEAVYLTLAWTGLFDSLPGLHVALVGRGHAVKGLEARLLARDATVTVCHSKTRDLGAILKTASVVVYCADTVDPNNQMVLASRKPAVLDVSGAVEKEGLHVYASASDLGKLNVSILMNRIATGRR